MKKFFLHFSNRPPVTRLVSFIGKTEMDPETACLRMVTFYKPLAWKRFVEQPNIVGYRTVLPSYSFKILRATDTL